jgi:thioredoxin 1
MSETVSKIEGSRFQDEVVKSELPVVVDFYADWCGPCRIISPVLEQLSREYQGKAKFVKIDTDANQELAGQFGIMSIPTVMFFSKGKIEDVVVGAVPAAIFKQKIQSLVG